MQAYAPDSPEALARVLAMFAVADRRLDREELEALDGMRAFDRIGVTRERFLEVAAGLSNALGGPHGWMRLSDLQLVDRLLAEVRDPRTRLATARLAAAVIAADGRIDETERVLFDQMLSRWRLTRRHVPLATAREGHAES